MSDPGHNPKLDFSKDQLLKLIDDLRCDFADRCEQAAMLKDENEHLKTSLSQLHGRSLKMLAGHISERRAVIQSIGDIGRRLTAAEKKSAFMASQYEAISLRDVLNGSRDLSKAYEVQMDVVEDIDFLSKTFALMINYLEDLQIPLPHRARPAESSASPVSNPTEKITTLSGSKPETPSENPTLSADDAATSVMQVVEDLLTLSAEKAPDPSPLKRKVPHEENRATTEVPSKQKYVDSCNTFKPPSHGSSSATASSQHHAETVTGPSLLLSPHNNNVAITLQILGWYIHCPSVQHILYNDYTFETDTWALVKEILQGDWKACEDHVHLYQQLQDRSGLKEMSANENGIGAGDETEW